MAQRDTLLALTRIPDTLETGEIVTKGSAVDAVIPTPSGPQREFMQRDGYLEDAADEWTGPLAPLASLVLTLVERIDSVRGGGRGLGHP